MSWILIGVIFTLAHTSRHRSTFDRVISTNGLAVDASPIPSNAPFLKPINPYIKHWEAAHFDVKIIAAARHQHEIRRRKRHANSTIAHDAATTTTTTTPAPPASSANTIKFQFFAHNREFRVLLREDPNSIFSPNVEIENTDGPIHYDVSRVYSGSLEDHDDSIVHGILTENNLFDGSIITPTENYYIEPASRYSNELIDNGIHTIVYKTSDVHMLPHQKAPSFTDAKMAKHFCASQRLHEKMKMHNKKQQLYDTLDIELSDKNTINKLNKPVPSEHLTRSKRWLADELLESRDPPLPIDLDAPYNDEFTVFSRKYNKDHNTAKTDEPWRNILITSYNAKNDYASRNLSKSNPNATAADGGDDRGQFRESNRILNATYSRPSHKTHVEIITKNGATRKPNIIGSNYNPEMILTRNNFHHHQHHSNINNNIHSNSIDAKSTYDRKSTCMLYLQADHTFFEKLGSEEASIEAITRHVQRANTIYKNTDFNGDGKADNITFMIKRIKIHTSNALKDTNYRFPGNYGVEKFLELFSEEDYDAFCLAYMFTYRDFEMGTLGLAWTGDLKNAGGVCEKNGHYRGSLKSLNTGIVTLLNYGKHVPPAVSHVTLAHEIGHNFGSPHDPELCTPGGEDGNFIMFARATSGDKKNNNKFSPCSLKAIEPVLNSKARSSKGCFTEPQQAICGNGVVDPGEECDCGWEEDCKDSCCYPMSTNPSIDEKPCTLTPRAYCSPSQGPCCTTSCTLKFGDKCRDDNGCRDPSFCNGQTAHCPQSVNKPNKTICNKEFVCFMGECTGSICLAYGLESCQCIPTANDPKTKSCELCCKLPGEGNPCKSSFEWNDKPYDVPDMYSKPGTPCNDYNGYCDVFQKCREVDPAGPLATLRRLLLSEESIESFKKWVMSNWFVVALIISGIIALLILSTRLFGKEINRKTKSVTIIHSATTETVRLPDDSNGVIVHAAIRTKVPLKKKVRGERSKAKRSSAVKNAESSSKNVEKTTTTAGVAAAAAAAVPTTSNSKSKTLKRSIEKHTKKIRSRKATADGVHAEGKVSKNPLASTMAKVKSSKSKLKSSTKTKETLRNTQRASADEDKLNAFGKVQQWLLDSPTQPATSALQELDQLDKTRPICKSQSQTHNLSSTQRSPKKVKSLSNLQEKVKLQVVYKPPFKLSLKLSKNSAVQTRPVLNANPAEASRNRRAARVDKARKSTGLVEKKKPRTALLLQSKSGRDVEDHGFRLKSNHRRTEDRQQLMPAAERKQDTLELKAEQQLNGGSGSGSSGSNGNGRGAINDEKNAIGKLIEATTNPVNTDTFKISKTSSGTKLLSNSSSALNEIDNPPSLCMANGSGSGVGENGKTSSVGHRNSFINNIRNSGTDYMASSSYAPNRMSSTSNLMKNDLHKITRSSTTNLSKNQSHRNSFDVKQLNFHDVNRSNSTHNFSKDRLSEALHSNLLKQPSHTRSSKTNLNNSENGSLPSSAVSSTSSTNTNTNTNSTTNMNAIDP